MTCHLLKTNNYVTIDDEVFGGWWIGYNISGGLVVIIHSIP